MINVYVLPFHPPQCPRCKGQRALQYVSIKLLCVNKTSGLNKQNFSGSKRPQPSVNKTSGRTKAKLQGVPPEVLFIEVATNPVDRSATATSRAASHHRIYKWHHYPATSCPPRAAFTLIICGHSQWAFQCRWIWVRSMAAMARSVSSP